MPLPGGIWPSVKVWCGSFLKESLGQNAHPTTNFRLNPQGLVAFPLPLRTDPSIHLVGWDNVVLIPTFP